jgi:outer membrane phospholipase A
MDANLSLKHPLLTPVIETVFDSFGFRGLQSPRLYMAFSSRFSQYIGTRESSPVIPRRYNPELFVRVWDKYEGYWDVGYGHESNGQQINSQASFELAEQSFRDKNEPDMFARDAISRGWDYVSLDWTKQWQAGFLPSLPGFTTTHFEFRRYLSDGLLQGAPEEYNDWERQGAEPKPRDEYDGLKFSIQYILPEKLCLIACFDRVEVMHQTGYGAMFDNNTNSIELTTSLFGIPFHIWAQSGYNSDLVDYYDYTNSWGIGVEFTR